MQVSQVSSECLEILAFLLHEINKNHDQSMRHPLCEWSDLLRRNGFKPEELSTFFVSADALEHWHGPQGIGSVYEQSLLAGHCTGDFLESVYAEESDYIAFISNKVDLLLAERNQLLATAGGTMKNPAGDGAAIGVSCAALFVSCFIAYKTRRSWQPKLKQWVDAWFTKQEVETVNTDVDNAISYEIKQISHPYKDIYKFAIEPLVPNAPTSDQQLIRERRRFMENPDAFLDEMIQSHPDLFDLTPAGFKAHLIKEYTIAIAAVQKEFNNDVDKIAKGYFLEWFNKNNPQHSVGKKVQDLEIKLARQTLLDVAKKNGDSEKMSTVFQWFQAKDERQRLMLLLDMDNKLLAQINDGTIESARLVQDLIKQFGGAEEFNTWLKTKTSAILASQDKIKKLDGLILDLDYSPEVRLLTAKIPGIDSPETIRVAEEQYKELEAAYQIYVNCLDLDHDIIAVNNNFTRMVEHLDINDLINWKYNAIEQIGINYGSDIANFVKGKYPGGSLETHLEEGIDFEVNDYLYKQIYGMLNLKPGQSIDHDLAMYLKNQAIDIINEMDSAVKGKIVDYFDAIIDV